MKRIIITLLLLPFSGIAMGPEYKTTISMRSLASNKEAMTKTATIFLNKEHTELFDFSDGHKEDKITAKLLLLKIENKKAEVRYEVETERVGDSGMSGGSTEKKEVIPMNEATDMNKLDRINALALLYQVQFNLTISDQKQAKL